MVVEDNRAIREGYKELLIAEANDEYGIMAHIDAFSNSDDAIKRLLEPNQPIYDLLFTAKDPADYGGPHTDPSRL